MMDWLISLPTLAVAAVIWGVALIVVLALCKAMAMGDEYVEHARVEDSEVESLDRLWDAS